MRASPGKPAQYVTRKSLWEEGRIEGNRSSLVSGNSVPLPLRILNTSCCVLYAEASSQDNLQVLWGGSFMLPASLCLPRPALMWTWPSDSGSMLSPQDLEAAGRPWVNCVWLSFVLVGSGCHGSELLDSPIVGSIYTTRLSSANKLLGCWFTSLV